MTDGLVRIAKISHFVVIICGISLFQIFYLNLRFRFYYGGFKDGGCEKYINWLVRQIRLELLKPLKYTYIANVPRYVYRIIITHTEGKLFECTIKTFVNN